MELVIFLAGIGVLIGLGMLLAWPRDEDIESDEGRSSKNPVQRMGKA